jgi:hypothetical protein
MQLGMSALGQKRTFPVTKNVSRFSAYLAFAMAPAFIRLVPSGKVRVGIAKATIASQHIRTTLFYRAIAAIPINTVFANRDYCAPGRLSFSWL